MLEGKKSIITGLLVVGLCMGMAACTGPEINPPLVIVPLPEGSVEAVDTRSGGESDNDASGGELFGLDAVDAAPESSGEEDTETVDRVAGRVEPEPSGEKAVEVVATEGGGWSLFVAGEPFSVSFSLFGGPKVKA